MPGQAHRRKAGSGLPCTGKKLGFHILQFNAVVENNLHARYLYKRLGFVRIGMVPRAFRMKDGSFENICLYYHTL